MSFARNDIGKDKAMGGVLLYILTAVLAFIFAVTISTTLEQEASVIGTLRASGYTRGELLRYYMSAPLLIVIIASVIGNVLGYTVFKNTVADMYYSSYSLPAFETLWTPEAFIKTTVVPIILMLIINIIVIFFIGIIIIPIKVSFFIKIEHTVICCYPFGIKILFFILFGNCFCHYCRSFF